MAFITTVAGGPNIPMAAPPSGGPSAVVVQAVASNLPLATKRSSGFTNAFKHAPLAALKTMSAAATITATTTSWAKLSPPSAYAAGTDISARNRSRSMAIMTGLLRRNSIHGPVGTASSAGSVWVSWSLWLLVR
jgi:hypothetical protein